MELWQILTIIFGSASVFLGFYWKKTKEIIKQLKILLDLISEVIEDDQITRKELKKLTDQIKNIVKIFEKKKIEKTIENVKYLKFNKKLLKK